MSTNDLLDQIKQATDYQINKQILKEKVATDLHINYNSGLFKLTPELIAFVHCWPEAELFLMDTYENPIAVTRADFLHKATAQYHSVMNDWHIQHNRIKRARKI